jgi:hypothetical protein
MLLIAEYSSGAHGVLININPALGFRDLLNCLLRGGADSCDNGLLVGADVGGHSRHLEEGLDSQGPPERLSPHCEIETFRCRVQPSATPWQSESRIGNNSGNVLTGIVPLHNNSQKY